MAKKELSKLTDEEYKAMTPQELMTYNKVMPEHDYENPYRYQPYPSVRYRLVRDVESGAARMQTSMVKNAEEDRALDAKEWKHSPADFGVVTAPAAPAVQIDDSFAVALAPEAPAPEPLANIKGEKAKGNAPIRA